MKRIELAPIKDKPEYWDQVELEITKLLREEIFLPLIKSLGLKKKILQNSIEDLYEAIKTGKITYYRGNFTGRFSASISKELKRLGAQWDRKQGSWKIPQSSLPMEVRATISASEARFTQVMQKIDRHLANLVPEEIADKLKVSHHFDSALFKVDQDFKKTLKNISVPPDLSREQRKKIADEWQNNMKLYIKDWSETAIKDLRRDVKGKIFEGGRYETMVKTIQKNYGVSRNKAKFLARQETNLLMAKFKETRYTEAGVKKYIWKTVAGSANHPVRPMHKALEGKIFSWDNPPITDEKGHRNNPGQDYNCRCFAKPVVEF